ncbi:MAG TPA: lysine biosynthesis protein LysX [Candidatus Marinimicrobia bacterium]|nr:lysine biosynthesis protein LysX [Candidatus Neomarinimicrobiota bacterium]
MNKVGILFSRMRKEEKLIFEEAQKMGVDLIRVDSRNLIMNGENHYDFNILLDREISHTRSLYTLQMLESVGVKTVNSHRVATICGDKVSTTVALNQAGVPTLQVKVAFSRESALEAIETMGYPVVLKPVIGSWGRLLAKINDRDSAEAILEHKAYLPSGYHSVFYIQEYVEKPGRDIRAFCIDGKTVCAIYRSSDHWITNTARGARAENCPLTPELINLCEQTVQAIGGGILAVDIMETKDGLVINEVNHKMEFRNSIDISGVNIPALILEYTLKMDRLS